jgi:flagellar biogenesis protein FliO
MDVLQQFAAAIIVLALLGALVLIAQKRGISAISLSTRSSRSRRMESVERLSLTPNHSLHIVIVDGKTVLLALSPAGCQLISTGEVSK